MVELGTGAGNRANLSPRRTNQTCVSNEISLLMRVTLVSWCPFRLRRWSSDRCESHYSYCWNHFREFRNCRRHCAMSGRACRSGESVWRSSVCCSRNWSERNEKWTIRSTLARTSPHQKLIIVEENRASMNFISHLQSFIQDVNDKERLLPWPVMVWTILLLWKKPISVWLRVGRVSPQGALFIRNFFSDIIG